MTIPTKERISEIELRMTDERMDELLAMKHVPAEYIFETMMALLAETMMALLAERDYVKALMEERECVLEILTDAPELNPSNYDHDEVCELNNAMIEAYFAAGGKKYTPPKDNEE